MENLKAEFKQHVKLYVLSELLKGNKQEMLDKIDSNITQVKRQIESSEDAIREQKVSFANVFKTIPTGVMNVGLAAANFTNSKSYESTLESHKFVMEVLVDLRKSVEASTSSPEENLAKAFQTLVEKK